MVINAKYTTYLFDMDGTLVDSFELIYSAFKKSFFKNTNKLINKQQFKAKLFGKPTHLIPELFGVTEELNVKIMQDLERFWIADIDKLKTFPRVSETLTKLKTKNKLLGVVSTSPRRIVELSLKAVKIYEKFDVIVAEEDVNFHKPHAEPVLTALRKLNTQPKNAVFVGDTEYDMKSGKNAGCATILLLGEHNKNQEIDADFKIERFDKLLNI
jgi:pyrophosphatase PpaX